MTAKQVQFRRGTTAEYATFTGAVGEITVDTTAVTARVHDGSTVGGFPLAHAGANTDITSVILDQTGLEVKGGSVNTLTIKPNETLGSDRTLNIVVNDADRTIDLSGNLTVSSAATISGTSSGTNTGDQNIFQTISVSGQSNVVADTTTDTLTFVAGTNITITTDASTDSITFNATGASVGDGDYGDITVSSSGTVWTIDNKAVTYAKIQDVSATDKILGRQTAGAGTIEEIDCTAAGRALLDDATASDQRTTLGLGTIATQAANSVSITGGSITGITDLAITDGGTGASDAGTARTNLGLAIGTDVQAYDPELTAIAALAVTDGNFIVGNGTTWVAESGATARTSLGLGTSDTPQFTGIEVGNASDTTLTRASAGNLAVEGNLLYRAGGTDVALADGGTGASLTDPNADRLMFWDDSAGSVAWLEAGSGLTISGTTITASGAVDRQVFNASGTWTKPASGTVALIECWGGGGSGGRRGTNGDRASGGGGGGYNYRLIALASLGATETATVGAGGAARSGSNQSGAAGGTTSFGSWVNAYGGGAGGQAAAGTILSGAGGGGQISAGGASSGTTSLGGQPNGVGFNFGASETSGMYFHGGGAGDANSTLNAGGNSLYGGGGGGSASNSGSSSGGASVFGGNGGAGATGTNAVATAGSQPGGGGGGAAGTSATSGAGGDGRVIVTVW